MTRSVPYSDIMTRCTEELGVPGLTVKLLADDPSELASAGRMLGRCFAERETATSTLIAQPGGEAVEAGIVELGYGIVDALAPLGHSVIAVDGEGDVVGLLLNEPWTGEELELPPALAPIADVLNALTLAFNADLAARPRETTALNVVMVATDPRYLGVGMMRHLLRATATLARRQGFGELVTEATSNSQIVFARGGMETLATVSYADIPVFASIPQQQVSERHPPITHARLMWAPIERAAQYDDAPEAEAPLSVA